MNGFGVNEVAQVIDIDFSGKGSFRTIQIDRHICEEDLLLTDSTDDIFTVIEPVNDTSGAFYSVEAADEPTKPDMVESPPHYNAGRFEVIDVIEDAVKGADGFEGACVANILKYTMRYRHKNGLEDVKKAAWYLARLERYLTERDEKGVD